MHLKRILLAILSAGALFCACSEEEDLGTPKIIVTPSEVEFTEGEGSSTLELLATRPWYVSSKPEWAALSVEEGKASSKNQAVTVSVNANPGNNRTGSIVFTIGLAKSTLLITQKGEKGEIQKGSGTLDDPYTVAGAVDYVKSLGKDVQSPDAVFIKGRISEVVTPFAESGTYGNATFYIVDEGNPEGDRFYVFQTYYLGKRKWATGDTEVKAGDNVIICGPVVYYKGDTPETAGKGESFVYSLNGKSEGGVTPPVDPSTIEQVTVAEFIAKASTTTYYRLVGKVANFKKGTNSSGRNWMQFDVKDDTGSILVYGFKSGQYELWNAKIQDGGDVSLYGTYDYYADKQQHEVMNAVVETFTEGAPIPTVTGTVAQTIAATDGSPVVVPEATVMALSTIGVVVSDGTADVYIYFDEKAGEKVPDVKIGDKVKVEATKATYGGIPEFTKPTLTVTGAGTAEYPEPTDITPIAATYTSAFTNYVSLTGKLTVSDKYYNIEIDGVDSSTRMGSISSPLESLGVKALDGRRVIVKGYFSGLTGSGRYINIVATSVAEPDPEAKFCTVAPASVSAKSSDTSATLTISSNAAWTVTSESEWLSVEPASGEGDGTVVVSFSENTAAESRSGSVRVDCEAAGVSRKVEVTQSEYIDPSKFTVTAALSANDGDKVTVYDAVVAALSTQGFIITDGTSNVYVYLTSLPTVKVGDKVDLEAVFVADYYGIPELKTAKNIKVVSSGNEVPRTDIVDITAGIDNYTSSATDYLSVTGKLVKDGDYYNVAVEGATRKASASGLHSSVNPSHLVGMDVIMKGYFNTIHSSKNLVQVIVTEIVPADPDAKYCTVSTNQIRVAADAVTASFSITANAPWTVSSDNEAVVVEPASGEGDGTVTLSFAANTGEAPVTANIKVSCEAASFEATVKFEQAKPSTGDSVTISLNFTTKIDALPQGSSSGVKDGTYNLSGYDFIFHAADKFYQTTSTPPYLLIGKANSYIQLPVLEGRALVGVKFRTGSAASESVVVDIAAVNGTRLNVNTSALKKGKDYDWKVPGATGEAYRILVTNSFNAQFQNLTLIYE